MSLGRFLSDLTSHLLPGDVHDRVLDALRLPNHDSRLETVLADPVEFAAMWEAVRYGLDAPSFVWEEVVLPATIAFSTEATEKVNLERAATLWLSMRNAAGMPRAGSIAMAIRPGVIIEHGVVPPVTTDPAADQTGATTIHKRLWAKLVPAVLVFVAVVVLLLTQTSLLADRPHAGPPAALPSVLPGSAVVPQPTVSPFPALSVQPSQPSTLPAPTPTWTGPGPVSPPSAPRSLVTLMVSTTSAVVGWQPPANSGTGGISHYRVYVNGVDRGWTSNTSMTVANLAPNTSYSIVIRAYNTAGAQSPPSSSHTVTTLPEPPPTPTDTPSESPTPAPTDTPSPTPTPDPTDTPTPDP